MLSETIAKFDHLARPVLTRLSPVIATQAYSSGRNVFLSAFFAEQPPHIRVAEELSRTLWDIEFRAPLLNAAGLFKNGEGYDLTYRQGAGGYLAGTTTAHKRTGNTRNGINKPFAPYPNSRAASNWLGLPNDGHAAVAKRLADMPHHHGFPIGASVMTAPESSGKTALAEVVEGMQLYDRAGVHFLELNESCPNVAHGSSSFEAISERLEYIADKFLHKRLRNLPVVVKFSIDAAAEDVPRLVDTLTSLGFDGINFGNTSTQYAAHRPHIHPADHAVFDYFTQTFGGGISGEPLRILSLELVRTAKHYLEKHPPHREFHIIRTGGIASGADIEQSLDAGASLAEWYTGLFERFSESGHRLYEEVWNSLL
jgi:dihydroorotate dehydrogenase